MRTGYIYRIWNKESGKSYVGQCAFKPFSWRCRIKAHFKGQDKQCRAIHSAIKKYGRDAFDYEILHTDVPMDALRDLENSTIVAYDTIAPNGYNLTAGGEGGAMSEETKRKIGNANRGKKRSPEFIEQMRKDRTGRKASSETRAKMSESQMGRPGTTTGKKLSVEHRAKISESNKGRKVSAETRDKIRQAHLGRKLSPEHRRKVVERNKSMEQRLKVSKALKGKERCVSISNETRKKLSESVKKSWIKRKTNPNQLKLFE